jgi:hypothetical protein
MPKLRAILLRQVTQERQGDFALSHQAATAVAAILYLRLILTLRLETALYPTITVLQNATIPEPLTFLLKMR